MVRERGEIGNSGLEYKGQRFALEVSTSRWANFIQDMIIHQATLKRIERR